MRKKRSVLYFLLLLHDPLPAPTIVYIIKLQLNIMTKKKSISSSSSSSYGIGDLCENISESISNLSKPCEDYANAQRIQAEEQRRFADLELAASTSTPYPLTHYEEGDDACSSISPHHPAGPAVVGCVTGAIPAMIVGLGKQSHPHPHHHHLGQIGSSVSSVPLNDNHEQHNNNNNNKDGPIFRQPQQSQFQIQQARKIAALPLHRKSSILCTTPDPQITSSSRLRQRKLHKRSSMLCDGYALLDCLHEEWSETTGNTEKGSALIRAERTTARSSRSRSRASKWSSTNDDDHNSIEARSTGSSSSAKFSRTPSMIKRTPSQEFERYTKMYSDMTSHHHHSTAIDNNNFIPPGIPLSISRSQGVESVSIATFASDAGFATADQNGGESSQNRYSSINNNNNNNNIRNPRSPKHYRRFASNEAFASSLRRSVQVLQKHDSHHMGGSRTNNKKILHRKDSFTSQLFDTKQQQQQQQQQLRTGGDGGSAPIDEQGGAEGEDGEFDTITGSKQTTSTVVPPPEQFPPPSTDDEIEAIIVDKGKAAAAVAAATKSSSTTTYPSKSNNNNNNGKSALQFITALHLSAFAILGALFRIFLVWLFSGAGGDCSSSSNNNNVWCVTSTGLDGNGSGVFFEELPANMVGSFLMGVLQKPSQDLRLLVASDMGIAFLPSQHWFQDWGIFHLGLRTGFCGSLSTLASWNTQMVQMIDGSASTNDDGSGSGGSNWVSAIFGYILGLQMSLACLSLGQEVAIWMYRKSNPALAKEEDVLMYAYTKDAQIAGVNGELQGNGVDDDDHSAAIRRQKLPDYEMRYLASLLPNEELRWATQNVGILKNLERWKVSTDETRLAGDPNMKEVRVLHQIEEAILVDEAEPSTELLEIASEKGWDVEALKQFAKDAHGVSVASNTDNNNGGRRRGNNNRGGGGGGGVRMKMGSISEGSSTSSGFLPIERTAILQAFVGYLPFVLAFVSVLVLIVLDLISNDDDDSIAYRHFWVSSLLAPLGAVLRWELSRFNGRLKGSLQWLPLGTFAANITASIISAAISGINDSSRIVNSSTLLYAIETGFAGSLSTVSSFVAEGNAMQSTYPHHAKAYYYMVGSLMVACAFGLIFYSSWVRTG